MVSYQILSGPNDAEVHCSIENNELRICPAKYPPAQDDRHVRRSLDGVLSNCCSSSKPLSPRTISLYEVLSTSCQDGTLRISTIRRKNKKRPVKTYVILNPTIEDCQTFVKTLWQESYRNCSSKKRVKVLLNPFGGSGKAKSIWHDTVAPIFEAAEYAIDVQETQYSGHASEIARAMRIESYDMFVCVSGDGLPHEVINGLASREDASAALRLPIAFIPAGSGNGSAKSIYDTQKHVDCALGVVKGVVTPVDLLSVTQGDRRFMSYFSVSYGVIADCDLGTEHLRWMGEARFTYGVVQRILSRTKYPCTLSLSILSDDKDAIRRQYHERTGQACPEAVVSSPDSDTELGLPRLKYGTIKDAIPDSWVTKRYADMGTLYVGMMPYMSSTACFFPTASPASGTLDVMHIQASIPFFSALGTVGAVDSAKHFGSDFCYYAKCDAFRLVPEAHEGYISVDGERVPFEPLQGELHRALGRIITKNGQYYSQFLE